MKGINDPRFDSREVGRRWPDNKAFMNEMDELQVGAGNCHESSACYVCRHRQAYVHTRACMHGLVTGHTRACEMRNRLQGDRVETVPRLCFQEFEEVSIYSQAAQRSFMMFVRKDNRALFQELYDKLEVRAHGCMQMERCPGRPVREQLGMAEHSHYDIASKQRPSMQSTCCRLGCS